MARYAVVALCFLPLFFIHIESYGSPFINALLDGAHIGVFFVVAWAVFPLIGGRIRRRIVILFAATAVASLAIEGIQDTVGRAFQWSDILRNLIGLGLGIALRTRLHVSSRQHKRWANSAILLFIAMFMFERATLLKLVAGQAYFLIKAPVLASFDYPFEAINWGAHGAEMHVENGTLRVSTLPNRMYAGVSFKDFPAQWLNFNSIEVIVENPQDKPVEMTLKITDREHEMGIHNYDDRYNGRLLIAPGLNKLTIPLSDIETAPLHRALNLQQVARIDLFLSQRSNGESFFLHHLALQ
ncbi:hypothetical protein [Alteromonas facilis]|uniref:hypothetical protein n=1 Tax=Alteromonas facilis TaxID=2048004 RepID=UPI000F5CAC75|nr:hypothetical protein [Alteromonas facilis]